MSQEIRFLVEISRVSFTWLNALPHALHVSELLPYFS